MSAKEGVSMYDPAWPAPVQQSLKSLRRYNRELFVDMCETIRALRAAGVDIVSLLFGTSNGEEREEPISMAHLSMEGIRPLVDVVRESDGRCWWVFDGKAMAHLKDVVAAVRAFVQRNQ